MLVELAGVSDAVAARLKTYLEAFTASRRGHLDQGPDHIDPDTGRRVPHAVRLACTADLVPVVLNGDGVPLHLGRARRLFDEAQRRAMGIRARGCDLPAAWCEAHHKTDWCRGGKTDRRAAG